VFAHLREKSSASVVLDVSFLRERVVDRMTTLPIDSSSISSLSRDSVNISSDAGRGNAMVCAEFVMATPQRWCRVNAEARVIENYSARPPENASMPWDCAPPAERQRAEPPPHRPPVSPAA